MAYTIAVLHAARSGGYVLITAFATVIRAGRHGERPCRPLPEEKARRLDLPVASAYRIVTVPDGDHPPSRRRCPMPRMHGPTRRTERNGWLRAAVLVGRLSRAAAG